MKHNLILVLGLTAILGVSFSASADVTGLSAKLGGGCITANTGACTIKVSASGSDLGSDSVLLEHSADGKGNWKFVSKNARSLDDNGNASFKFRNQGGCYRVVTNFNGNDTPDVKSRAVCEK